MRPRVKVCGVRRIEDARLAVELGAAYIGCVRAGDSPRAASIEEVGAIRAAVGDRARVVLVFRRDPLHEVLRTCTATGIGEVQVHGATAEHYRQLEERGLVAWRVYSITAGATALPSLAPPPTQRRPAIVDTGPGGTGRSFSWDLLGPRAPRATFVAGGITPRNLPDLLAHEPWGIDVSSGVERSPGEKDPALLHALFTRLENTA